MIWKMNKYFSKMSSISIELEFSSPSCYMPLIQDCLKIYSKYFVIYQELKLKSTHIGPLNTGCGL